MFYNESAFCITYFCPVTFNKVCKLKKSRYMSPTVIVFFCTAQAQLVILLSNSECDLRPPTRFWRDCTINIRGRPIIGNGASRWHW